MNFSLLVLAFTISFTSPLQENSSWRELPPSRGPEMETEAYAEPQDMPSDKNVPPMHDKYTGKKTGNTNRILILPERWSANPSPLDRRLVGEGCEIANPHKFTTCNPPKCGDHPLVYCIKSAVRCTGTDLNLPTVKDICGGCACRSIHVPPKSAKGDDVASKRTIYVEQQKVARLQGPLFPGVRDGREIYNPMESPTCKPVECEKSPFIACSRANYRGYCLGEGFNSPLAKHICSGCGRRSPPSPHRGSKRSKERKMQDMAVTASLVSKGHHKKHDEANLGTPQMEHPRSIRSTEDESQQNITNSDPSHELKSEQLATHSTLDRRRIEKGCAMWNPRNSPSCFPEICRHHEKISCTKLVGSCVPHNLDLPEVQNICKGCECRLTSSTWTISKTSSHSMRQSISENCEIANPHHSPECKVKECADRPEVYCTQVSEHKCSGGGFRIRHNLDVCRRCICQHKAGLSIPETPRVSIMPQEDRIAHDCEIVGPKTGKACNPEACSARVQVFCRKITGKCTPKGMSMLRNLDVCTGCRCQNKPKKRANLPESTQVAPDKRPKTLWENRAPTTAIKDLLRAPMQRREVEEGCEIYHAWKSMPCNPIECGNSKYVSCSRPGVGVRCMGYGMNGRLVKDICGGCKCRKTFSWRNKGTPKGFDQRTRVPIHYYPPNKALIADDCQINNPGKLSSCNPNECAKRPGVTCMKAGIGTRCVGGGFNTAYNRHVCGGCGCQSRRDHMLPAPSSPDSQGSRNKRIKSSGILGPTHPDLFQIQRREVVPPCEITNPRRLSTCNPGKCGRRPDVHCPRWPGGGRCLGVGMRVKENRYVCGGCRCALRPNTKVCSTHSSEKVQDHSPPGRRTKGIGKGTADYEARREPEETQNERRTAAEPCEIQNPNKTSTYKPEQCCEGHPVPCMRRVGGKTYKGAKTRRKQDMETVEIRNQIQRRRVEDGCEIYNLEGSPTYNPSLCGLMPTVLCSRPGFRNCLGLNLDSPENRAVCQGCGCRSPAGSRPGSHPSKQKAQVMRIARHYVRDGCEIVSMIVFASCNPIMCTAMPLVGCNRPYGGNCMGQNIDRPEYAHICGGCECRSKPGSRKRLKYTHPEDKNSGLERQTKRPKFLALPGTPSVPLVPSAGGRIQRRHVAEGYVIFKPDGPPTCHPVECAMMPTVACSRLLGNRCIGRNSDLLEYGDVCGGCTCRQHWFHGKSKTFKPQDDNKSSKDRTLQPRLLKLPGPAPSASPAKNGIRRRYEAGGCKIFKLETTPNCHPAQCAAMTRVACSRLLGSSCVAVGLDIPEYAHVCKGCVCRQEFVKRKRKNEILEDKRGDSEMSAKRPKEKSQRITSSSGAKQIQPREVSDPCEITNTGGAGTCKAKQCGDYPLVSCKSVLGSEYCRREGHDAEEVRDIAEAVNAKRRKRRRGKGS